MNARSVRVRLSGTAAGGGLPQWNCACFNCQEARKGNLLRRGQCLIALGCSDGWLFLNAPPDLSESLFNDSALHPHADSPRNSRARAVLLTSADLDHALGILSMREGEPLDVHATARIRQTLDSALNLTGVMESFCGIRWHEPPTDKFDPILAGPDGAVALEYRAIPLPGHVPRMAKNATSDESHRVAYEFVNRATAKRLVVATDVGTPTKPLRQALERADIVLFDGTFWSEDELARIKPEAAPASGMGHIPMQESLALLRSLPARHKAYVHINNTNPALRPDSRERAEVEAARVMIPDDGVEFEL